MKETKVIKPSYKTGVFTTGHILVFVQISILKDVYNISKQHNLHNLRDKSCIYRSKSTFAESKPIRENFTDNDTAVFEVVNIACNSKALRKRKEKKNCEKWHAS